MTGFFERGSRGNRVGWLPVLLLILGCGHTVSPSNGFENPASIPRPVDVVAFSTVAGVNVIWSHDDEIFAFIDGFYLYKAEGESHPPDASFTRTNQELLLERTFIDRDVENNTRYWYRLTSMSPAGIESLPTPAAPVRVDFTPPAPPTGLTATPEVSGVRLNWNASPEPDLEHYNIFREPPQPPLVFGPIPPEIPFFLDLLAQSGDTLSYWITAVDVGLNESTPSDTVVVIVP